MSQARDLIEVTMTKFEWFDRLIAVPWGVENEGVYEFFVAFKEKHSRVGFDTPITSSVPPRIHSLLVAHSLQLGESS